MEIIEPFNMIEALFLHVLLSVFYIHFILIPLLKIDTEKKYNTFFSILFILRLIVVAICDIYIPTIMVFGDFLLLFILSFTLVPKIKKKVK